MEIFYEKFYSPCMSVSGRGFQVCVLLQFSRLASRVASCSSDNHDHRDRHDYKFHFLYETPHDIILESLLTGI